MLNLSPYIRTYKYSLEEKKVLVETICLFINLLQMILQEMFFGLFETLPQHKEESEYYYFLNSVILFSPKPQLFNEFSKLHIDEELTPVTP